MQNIENLDFKTLSYIGEGTEGIVRKYNEVTLYKVMYDEEFSEEKKTSIIKQCTIKNDSFIFPNDILYVSGIYKGYTQEYIKGNIPTIENLDDLNLSLKNIKSLEHDITMLSKYHLLIKDLITRNSIYYNDKLYIIDTSRYTYEEDYSVYLIENFNKRMLNYFFINLFFTRFITDNSISNFEKFIRQIGAITSNLYDDMYGNVNCYFNKPQDFSMFLELMMEEFKTESLSNMHNKILKFKKMKG